MKKAMLVALLAALPAAAEAQEPELRAAVEQDYRANLAVLFDHFQRNPELSGLERRTAERMGQELRALDYEVTTGVGGTGVVALLRNGAGPTVMLRTEMDALPVEENTGLPFASIVKGVMHACGHDIHMSAWAGTAKLMAALTDVH